MPDIQFVNGLRAKRNDKAPNWAICKLTARKSELLQWLDEQPDDDVFMEVLRAKSTGNLYIKVDEEGKEYAAKIREEELAKARASVEPQEIPEDDIPF